MFLQKVLYFHHTVYSTQRVKIYNLPQSSQLKDGVGVGWVVGIGESKINVTVFWSCSRTIIARSVAKTYCSFRGEFEFTVSFQNPQKTGVYKIISHVAFWNELVDYQPVAFFPDLIICCYFLHRCFSTGSHSSHCSCNRHKCGHDWTAIW